MSELPFVSIRRENVGSRVLLDDEWMAEILVRRLLFALFFLRVTPWGLTTSATGSGTKTLKRKSFSFVALCLLWSYFLNRVVYPTSAMGNTLHFSLLVLY